MYTEDMAASRILSIRAKQVEEDELYHHGIKGQKWGVRRYQNEDGSLTSEGMKRYYINGRDESGGLTKAGQKWKTQYDRKNKEYTEEDAKRDREKKIKTALAVAAGLTVAAAAVYATNKVKQHVSVNLDETIKVGDIVGNVSLNDKGKADAAMAYVYNNKNLADKLKYEGFYANGQMRLNARIRGDDPDHYNVNKIKALKDVKIAGKDTAMESVKKVLNSLSDEDKQNYFSELRKDFGATSADKEAIFKGDAKKAYGLVNRALMDDRNPTVMKVRDAVVKDLKDRGYGGIKDNNDRGTPNLLNPLNPGASGYFAKANILFNDKNNFDYSNNERINYDSGTSRKKHALGIATILGSQYVNGAMKNDLVLGAAAAGISAGAMKKRAKQRDTNGGITKNDINAIQNYKRKGLTNREIAQKLNIAESTVSNYAKV